MFDDRARKGLLRLTNFTPSTGIGKFDAQYHPATGKLAVTVKVSYTWILGTGVTSAWTTGEMQQFKDRLKQICEDTWSGCYQLASDKADWRDLHADVEVKVEEVTTGRHYTIEVAKTNPGEAYGSGIQRDIMQGRFCIFDVDEESGRGGEKRDKGAFVFVANQLEKIVADQKVDYIPFPKNASDPPVDVRAQLAAFASAANRVLTPEAVAAGLRIFVYGKSGSADGTFKSPTLGSNRAKKVAAFLSQKLTAGNAVQVVESSAKQPWITGPVASVLRAHKFSDADQQSRSFPGVMLLVKNPVQTATSSADLPSMSRHYVVVAHEFGHMLGLPDEYFGVNCMNLAAQVDLRSALIPAALRNLMQYDPNPADPDYATQHKAYAAAIQQAGVPAPIMMNTKDVVTESIMYGGPVVLPAHYLPFWEALLKICRPYFLPTEWKIVPNATGAAKRSDLRHFVT